MGMRVLLIDDDEDVLQLLEIWLLMESPSLEVRGTGRGERALEICGRWRPDALVVDGHMPGTSGDDLGLALRAIVPDATIVSFTGTQSDVSWADVQVVKATDGALQNVVQAVTRPH